MKNNPSPSALGVKPAVITLLLASLVACSDGVGDENDGVYAPGINRFASTDNAIDVGHRLIEAGEYELALRAFSRAAIARGQTDAEVLLGMGTANLGLGRLGQAEEALRLAVSKQDAWPELYNNLGVVLMEKGEVGAAAQIFHKAYAMDNGASDSIRDNLRLALSKTENPAYSSEKDNNYKLVRRGSSDYLIRQTP